MSNWCKQCGRLKNVGCACELSFAEKIKTVGVDKKSLTESDKMWREYDDKAGGLERRRKWGESKLKT